MVADSWLSAGEGQDSVPDWGRGMEREEPRRRVKGPREPSGLVLDITPSKKPSRNPLTPMLVTGPCSELPLQISAHSHLSFPAAQLPGILPVCYLAICPLPWGRGQVGHAACWLSTPQSLPHPSTGHGGIVSCGG